MVVSLVDALASVPDLAQLDLVVDTVVALPCRRRFGSPSTKRMTNDIAIPLSPTAFHERLSGGIVSESTADPAGLCGGSR